MSARRALEQLLDSMPEERLSEVLDFARYVAGQEERAEWRAFGQLQLARAYGENEPEYSEADIKQERR